MNRPTRSNPATGSTRPTVAVRPVDRLLGEADFATGYLDAARSSLAVASGGVMAELDHPRSCGSAVT